jgi:hypothetical protein
LKKATEVKIEDKSLEYNGIKFYVNRSKRKILKILKISNKKKIDLKINEKVCKRIE